MNLPSSLRMMPVLLVLAVPARAPGAEPAADPAAAAFFESQVRPLLAEHCAKCHGEQKQKGGLRLDSRAAILQGGDSGPAVVPGNLEESLLIAAIHYEGPEMPPAGQLPEDQQTILARWVELGAPWPGAEGDAPAVRPKTKAAATFTAEDRALWSVQPLRRPDVPAVERAGWVRNPIDAFILHRLDAEGLEPAPEADRRTLIRRLAFDLTGLPPSPEDVAAFLADDRPDAYEQLVDRLLNSPRYGERWARHWLDLVRYAESDGYRQDAYRPDAWRYRDYVVRAFNDDKPYDRFVAEQLAGDELDPADPELRTAVGFLRLGTYEFNQRDVPAQWSAILNDITDVTADVFLGLGLGCARCHDHKFDPLLQQDYYRLQAFFTPIQPRDDMPLASADAWAAYQEQLAAWEAASADLRAEIAAIEAPYREKAAADALAKFPAEMQALLNRPAAERTPREQQLAELAYRQVTYEYDHIDGVMKKSKDKERWGELTKRLAADYPRPEPPPSVLTVTDIGPVAPPTTIPGDRAGRDVPPGFPTLLDPAPAKVVRPAAAANSTGRRSALARWIGRPDNPLSTRVMANRVWQYHFGRGIVATPSDLGRLGEAPSHPELLDWLASEFVARGWHLKALHRLILTSATYRQAALPADPALVRTKDPENRLLSHAPTRRLDIEPLRDALLSVSGELDLALGGPSVDPKSPRRTLYTKVMRNNHDPLIESFDAPDGSTSTPVRLPTTTPTQSLLMINGPFTLSRARAFAARLLREADDDAARVELAYRLSYARPPEPTELADALEFLASQRRLAEPPGPSAECGEEAKGAPSHQEEKPVDPGFAALVDFCHAMLNASEFLYVD